MAAASTAQRRCGHCRPQVSMRRYSPSVASIRIEATSWLASGAIAVAVWVLLFGSIPISIIGDGPFLLGRVKGSAADSPTSRYSYASASSSRASVESSRERAPGGRHTEGEPAKRRQKVLESARLVSYETLRAADPTTPSLHHIQVGEYWKAQLSSIAVNLVQDLLPPAARPPWERASPAWLGVIRLT